MDQKHTEVQKKTFTRWMNYHLSKRNMKVDDLFTGLKDGLVLINLLEVLADKKITYKYNPAPKIQIHELENIGIALKWTALQAIRLVNIGGPDIHEGRPKPTLGLIWALISRYQSGGGDSLLDWVNNQIKPYTDVPLATNFTSSWQDGKVLNALVDSLKKGLVEMGALTGNPLEDVKKAMSQAEIGMGIPQLMDPNDLVDNPEEHSLMTYISLFREYVERAKKEALDAKRKGKPDPTKSYAAGPGLEHAVTNNKKPAQFTIYSLNEDGQPTLAKTARVEIVGPDGKNRVATVKDNEDATYSVSYTPDVPGDYTITVLLDAAPIKDMPVVVSVKQGADASKSNKLRIVFTVTAHLKNGERKTEGGDDFSAVFKPAHPIDLVDNKDGTYSARTEISGKGSRFLSLALNDNQIAPAPFYLNSS